MESSEIPNSQQGAIHTNRTRDRSIDFRLRKDNSNSSANAKGNRNKNWRIDTIKIDIFRHGKKDHFNNTRERKQPTNITCKRQTLRDAQQIAEKARRKYFPTEKTYDMRVFLHTEEKNSRKTSKPKTSKICFHTFRHWKGTMEYHKLKDLRAVQKILGHKSILTTQTYENTEAVLFLQDADEWICKVAHNEQEEIELIQANFIFVNKRENPYNAFYKKRK